MRTLLIFEGCNICEIDAMDAGVEYCPGASKMNSKGLKKVTTLA